ncbi:MAG: SIS domain-containing protein [bacterium]|nr:SIS domain-containing protein [bacterium]
MSSRPIIEGALLDARSTLDALLADPRQLDAIGAFADAVVTTVRAQGRLLSCGNGGSMSDAVHFASEWTGRFRDDRRPVSAISLSDAATITCIANDYGFDQVFARQVEAHGREGDLLVAISTSGLSPNVVAAVQTARRRGLRTVGLLGRGGGKLASEVEIPIVVPRATTADRIQEVHIQIIHAVIEAVERQLFPEIYAD